MDTNERTEHFQSYATLLYPDLARLFLALYSARVMGNEEQVKQVEKMIKDLLAQRGYDLAYHVLDNIWEVHNPEALLDKTPDLTKWPT